jgi:hypothetical protein
MRTGYLAIGLAAVVGVVPVSSAQAPRVLGHGKSAGTLIEAQERQTDQRPGSGVFVEVPIGRVSVGPEFLGGEPIYVRRMTVKEGMAIVEVSTTPFMPVSRSNEKPPGADKLIGRSDQPASW